MSKANWMLTIDDQIKLAREIIGIYPNKNTLDIDQQEMLEAAIKIITTQLEE